MEGARFIDLHQGQPGAEAKKFWEERNDGANTFFEEKNNGTDTVGQKMTGLGLLCRKRMMGQKLFLE